MAKNDNGGTNWKSKHLAFIVATVWQLGSVILGHNEVTLSATGRLACQVCEFDFALVYGTLGQGFAECHHVVPLSELPNSRTTRLADLAIVCANCHRMLHRARPAMIVSELRKVVQEQAHLFLLGKKQPDEASQ